MFSVHEVAGSAVGDERLLSAWAVDSLVGACRTGCEGSESVPSGNFLVTPGLLAPAQSIVIIGAGEALGVLIVLATVGCLLATRRWPPGLSRRADSDPVPY